MMQFLMRLLILKKNYAQYSRNCINLIKEYYNWNIQCCVLMKSTRAFTLHMLRINLSNAPCSQSEIKSLVKLIAKVKVMVRPRRSSMPRTNAGNGRTLGTRDWVYRELRSSGPKRQPHSIKNALAWLIIILSFKPLSCEAFCVAPIYNERLIRRGEGSVTKVL